MTLLHHRAERILCYACGRLIEIPSDHRIIGRRRVLEEVEYMKLRTENRCPNCNAPLELMANLAAGKERMTVEHAQWTKVQGDKEGFV